MRSSLLKSNIHSCDFPCKIADITTGNCVLCFHTPKKILFLRECYTSILRGFIMKNIIKKNITISITILFVRGEREKQK
jgi:hypothetical protein